MEIVIIVVLTNVQSEDLVSVKKVLLEIQQVIFVYLIVVDLMKILLMVFVEYVC